MGVEAPYVRDYLMRVPAVGTAANDSNVGVLVCPFAGTVTEVTYVPDTAINGAATNNRTINLIDAGQAGTSTQNIATLNFANGTNAAQFDEKALTLNATPANLVVAQGDVLTWQSLHIGTGITDPGGMIHIQISRNDEVSSIGGPYVAPIPD